MTDETVDVGGGFYKIYIARLNSTIPLCLQASLRNWLFS